MKEVDPNDIRALYLVTDGCSSKIFKYIAKAILAFSRIHRNYGCSCCFQHDFDFMFGPKYGIPFQYANIYLKNCVTAAGHPKFARIMYWFVSSWLGKRVWNEYRKRDGRKSWMI